jgi:hypothetical protein
VAYFVVPPAPIVEGTVQLITTSALSKVSGGYQAVVTVKNIGTGTAQAVVLTGATLGGAGGSVIPQTIGNLAPGGSAAVVVTFPATAGASGAAAVEGLSGTYTGGTFGANLRVRLP